MPDLHFWVEGAEVLEFAAVPTLLFTLRLQNLQGEAVRSVALKTQIRIIPAQRFYRAEEQGRLGEVFGEPQRWGDTLKSLVWTHTVVLVPPFTGSTVVDMPVTCTYDFEVVSSKYFHTLEDGDIPLEFLFSGSIFYRGEDGALQIVQIPWEKEAQFRLPVGVWKQMMAHYFPNSAWLRVQRDTFDRLYAYKVRTGQATWEAALEQLLGARKREGRNGYGGQDCYHHTLRGLSTVALPSFRPQKPAALLVFAACIRVPTAKPVVVMIRCASRPNIWSWARRRA